MENSSRNKYLCIMNNAEQFRSESIILKEGRHRVHVRKWGSGGIPIIALHGFSDDGTLFDVFKPVLGNECTFYAIDLPFHGLTKWESHVVSRRRIRHIVFELADRHLDVPPILLAYSYGGRLVLSVFPKFFSRFGALWLFAPAGTDSVVTRYSMLHPLEVRLFWLKLVGRPRMINWLARVSRKVGILNRMQFNFFMLQTKTPELRQQLYNVWISLALFPVRKKWITKMANKAKLPVAVFWGSRDLVTPISQLRSLEGKVDNLRIFKTTDNHQLINEGMAEVLAKALPELLEDYRKNVRNPKLKDNRSI